MLFFKPLILFIMLYVGSLPTFAARITYIGDERVELDTEEPPEEGFFFSKKEEARYPAVKGICRNGQPFLVIQRNNLWEAIRPTTVRDRTLSPAELAFIACGEPLPEAFPTRTPSVAPSNPLR
jgi:hypothetical protein